MPTRSWRVEKLPSASAVGRWLKPLWSALATRPGGAGTAKTKPPPVIPAAPVSMLVPPAETWPAPTIDHWPEPCAWNQMSTGLAAGRLSRFGKVIDAAGVNASASGWMVIS